MGFLYYRQTQEEMQLLTMAAVSMLAFLFLGPLIVFIATPLVNYKLGPDIAQ